MVCFQWDNSSRHRWLTILLLDKWSQVGGVCVFVMYVFYVKHTHVYIIVPHLHSESFYFSFFLAAADIAHTSSL